MRPLPLILALSLAMRAQSPSIVRLYPVDEAGRDPKFRSYAARLGAAVEARNPQALRKLVDDNVFIGPGDDDKGWAKFADRWHPADPDSPLWDTLSDLLSLGFVREHPSLFISPYLVWRFPRDLNPATHLVIIRDQAALRQAPSINAPEVALLSFDIVRQLGQPERGEGLGEWVPIRTLDGKTGYLNTRDTRSPLMPRAQFMPRHGHWVLTALEGGD